MENRIDLKTKSGVPLLILGFLWLVLNSIELRAQPLKNCSEIHFLNPSAPSGIYSIDPDGDGPLAPMDCQCDMTTDGGGWTLVLNYNHLLTTDPPLNVFTVNLPMQGQTALGFDESNTVYWGHAGVALMTAIPFDEVRFYGITSDHSRIMNFKTSHAGTISYFKTGIGSTEGISTDFTPFTSHSTFLPAAVNMTVTNMGDFAMTAYPLWNGATYHWYLGGADPLCVKRWEVDDYPCTTPSTFHQIWARQNASLGVMPDAKSIVNVNLSPNPFNVSSELTLSNISQERFENCNIHVKDLLGKQVYPVVDRNTGSFTIYKGSLNPGIYFCILSDDSGVLTSTKMIIK
jgi:hypothetical protein